MNNVRPQELAVGAPAPALKQTATTIDGATVDPLVGRCAESGAMGLTAALNTSFANTSQRPAHPPPTPEERARWPAWIQKQIQDLEKINGPPDLMETFYLLPVLDGLLGSPKAMVCVKLIILYISIELRLI
jgi:hypothetical protein